MTHRTVVYLDYHNARWNAGKLWGYGGVFNPWELGQAIAQAHDKRYTAEPPLEVVSVRVYVPRPRSKEQRKNFDRLWYGWHDKCQGRISRVMCRRMDGQVKDLHTQLSTDLLGAVQEGQFDVAVLFSTDRDFRPVVQEVCERFTAQRSARLDLAGWAAPSAGCFRLLDTRGMQAAKSALRYRLTEDAHPHPLKATAPDDV